jgi:DNA-binding NarL/FixJ family response regulator
VVVGAGDPHRRRELVGVLVAGGLPAVAATDRDHASLAVGDGELLVLDARDGTLAPAMLAAVLRARGTVLVLAADDDAGLSFLLAGAGGYLVGDPEPGALVRAVRAAAAGQAVLPRAQTVRLLERLRALPPEPPRGLRPVRSPLTRREWEVLDLLCEGSSTAEVALTLDLAVETVRTHIKSLIRKLGVHTRAEAVAIARDLRSALPDG